MAFGPVWFQIDWCPYTSYRTFSPRLERKREKRGKEENRCLGEGREGKWGGGGGCGGGEWGKRWGSGGGGDPYDAAASVTQRKGGSVGGGDSERERERERECMRKRGNMWEEGKKEKGKNRTDSCQQIKRIW